jgi:hypothetical protein
MSGIVIAIIRTEENLYIFYKRRKKDTKDRAINTDGSLMPVIINKVVPYRDLEELRLFYKVNDQDPYFFIQEKLLPGTVIH